MLNILILEDDPYFRSELQSVIHFQPNLQCVLASPSAEHLREQLPTLKRIDLAFVDIDLPGESGLDVVPFLAKQMPDCEIVMLTQVEQKEALLRAFHNGARGYLLKDFPLVQLPRFITIFKEGGALISPIMARYLIAYFGTPVHQSKGLEHLSPKENQVLMHLAEGSTYEEVAQIMGLSLNGVRFHVKQIYTKLNVHKRMDAVKIWKGG